ncbi:MAG: diaminopimelate epimerase [Sphingobacteriia bacterium]|nr:MAG: diaminopimelate epimerase [Sphingobacteriia bacterium]
MGISFFKYQGTGNDFIILDNRDGMLDLSTAQVAQWCHRRFGVGADGLMLLETVPGFDFGMTYYNADGAPSTMCGNGGRCLVQFAHHQGIRAKSYRFLAVDGPHQAYIDERDWVHLEMKNVSGWQTMDNAFVLHTGSPHYVAPAQGDLAQMDVAAAGRAIRNSPAFLAEGINVNFVAPQGEALFVRTYERGVEAETYSCGTGVTAAALAHALPTWGQQIRQIQTLGGPLQVRFNRTSDQDFSDIWLSGPAQFVFQGTINFSAA